MMWRFVAIALIWFSIAAIISFHAATEALNSWYHYTATEWSAR